MIPEGLDPDQRADFALEDEVLADRLAEYILRRELLEAPNAHDLLATAAEFGPRAVATLRTLMALYERLSEDERRHGD